MAVRIPVVVSQSARRDGRSVELEESLITQLMLAPGLDATIVASLETIQFDSTDHLCLQDSGQEMILAGWLPLESAASAWARLQLGGRLCSFERSGPVHLSTGAAPDRRIRYLQLTLQTRVDEVIQQLEQILASRRVHTVSIQLQSQPPQNPKNVSPGPNPHQTAKPESLPPADSVLVGDSAIRKHDSSSSLSPAAVDSKSNDWENLDKLVDDLDALDL